MYSQPIRDTESGPGLSQKCQFRGNESDDKGRQLYEVHVRDIDHQESLHQRGGVAARDRLGSMEQEAEDSLSELHAKVECKLKTACLFYYFILFYFILCVCV